MGAGASVDALSLDGELKELLSYYDGNLESAADAVNREIVRVVPKTGSGRFVPERGEQTAVQGVVDRATKLARLGYESAWEGYKAADGDAARQSADDFLAETRRLEEDFPDTPPPPRCDLPEGASIDALAALAYFHGEDLLESLRRFVQDAGGEYKRGPRKSKSRIRQKNREGLRRRRGPRRRPRARDRHLRLRGRPELRHLAAEGRLPPGRDHDPALQGPLQPPVRKRLPRPATERRAGRLCWGAPVEFEAYYRGEGQGAQDL
mmetsp:Transcript_17918/g.53209  ORF Transcript_17918/g.53209 Transcript_17918/m.53209 type:complete len:264 (-) Transcript_17918:693-1484(-)